MISGGAETVTDIPDWIMGREPRQVPKSTVVERLIAAGKLRAAYSALQLEAQASTLTDQQFALRERWMACVCVFSNDPDVTDLLTAIGADPAVILGP